MSTETPLKDAYQLRMKSINTNTRYTDKDITELEKGDYVCIKTAYSQFFGFVKSVGRVNVIIESPYIPRQDCDYDCIQNLKFPKNQVKIFCKPYEILHNNPL